MKLLPASIVALAALAVSPLSLAQPLPPRFEVATVKPADPSNPQKGIGFGPGGRTVTIKGLTIGEVIQRSWNVMPFQVSGGPPWIGSERFTITAKAEDGPPVSQDQFGLMLQQLLADRFGFKFHRETKEFPILSLVTAKNGPKLTESVQDGTNLSTGRGQVTASKVPMSMFATALGRYLGSPVTDDTGLKGKYDFKLQWTPSDTEPVLPTGESAASADVSGPSIFTALQEQLGLKLESKKGPLEVLVIDHVEKPSEN